MLRTLPIIILVALSLVSCDGLSAQDDDWVEAHSSNGMSPHWVRGVPPHPELFIPAENGPYNTYGASIFWPECPAFYDSRLRHHLFAAPPTPPQ